MIENGFGGRPARGGVGVNVRRSAIFRLLTVLIGIAIPAALVLVVELALRVAGSGHPAAFYLEDRQAGTVRPSPDFTATLAFTVRERMRIQREIVRRLTSPPFDAIPESSSRAAALSVELEQMGATLNDPVVRNGITRTNETALRSRPDDLYLLRNLGRWHSKTGRHPATAELFRRALEIHPDAEKLRYLLGKALIDSGDVERGKQQLLEVAALEPSGFAEMYDLLGRVAVSENDLEGAVRWLRGAVELEPGNAELREALESAGGAS
jgi:tetratricopeptide (TPR) repeat protein